MSNNKFAKGDIVYHVGRGEERWTGPFKVYDTEDEHGEVLICVEPPRSFTHHTPWRAKPGTLHKTHDSVMLAIDRNRKSKKPKIKRGLLSRLFSCSCDD